MEWLDNPTTSQYDFSVPLKSLWINGQIIFDRTMCKVVVESGDNLK